jgi:hypothetical protein
MVGPFNAGPGMKGRPLIRNKGAKLKRVTDYGLHLTPDSASF